MKKPIKNSFIDLDDLRALIELAKDTEVSELEIEKSGVRVRIKMPGSPEEGGSPIKFSQPSMTTPSPQGVPEKDKKEDERYHIVRSPIVGTFYRTPAPDADPYVDVGDMVKKGQILCIIEAMKLMNEIESEVDGRIMEILVENGKPVEYGEALFKIEPL